jgi:hypothetical protein
MTQRSILVALPLLVALAILWGCDNDTDNDVAGPPGGGTDKTCIGCHSSEDELKAALGDEAKVAAIDVYNKDDG